MSDREIYQSTATQQPQAGALDIATHKVLKNTYLLLAMTLLFSAATAAGAMAIGIGRGSSLLMFAVAFLLLMFVLPRTQNSASGIWVVFAFTGLLGASMGPMLTAYLSLANGPALVTQALAGTALVFFGLSAYVLTTRKDFSFLGGFLIVGLLVVIATMILALGAAFFFNANITAVSLATSAAIMLLMSGFILYDTSNIIHGGETNYIRATVGLYLNIYNLFSSMLHLLGFMDE